MVPQILFDASGEFHSPLDHNFFYSPRAEILHKTLTKSEHLNIIFNALLLLLPEKDLNPHFSDFYPNKRPI